MWCFWRRFLQWQACSFLKKWILASKPHNEKYKKTLKITILKIRQKKTLTKILKNNPNRDLFFCKNVFFPYDGVALNFVYEPTTEHGRSTFPRSCAINSPPKRKKLFFVISLITILIFGLIFVRTFFRKEIYDGVKAEVITEYQNSLSESEKQNIRTMDEATILEKISADDKELLDFLDSYYYWYIVLWLPVAFFLLMLYQIGKCTEKIVQMTCFSPKINIRSSMKYLKTWRDAQDLKKWICFLLMEMAPSMRMQHVCQDIAILQQFILILLIAVLKNNDLKTLKMVLGHIRYNHVKWWYNLLALVENFPVTSFFLRNPLSATNTVLINSVQHWRTIPLAKI